MTESTNDRVLPKYKAVKTIASAVVLLTCYGVPWPKRHLPRLPAHVLLRPRLKRRICRGMPSNKSIVSLRGVFARIEVVLPKLTDILFKNFKARSIGPAAMGGAFQISRLIRAIPRSFSSGFQPAACSRRATMA